MTKHMTDNALLNRKKLIDELTSFLELKGGWGGDDSRKVDPAIVAAVKSFIQSLPLEQMPHFLMPCHYGGIEMEWTHATALGRAGLCLEWRSSVQIDCFQFAWHRNDVRHYQDGVIEFDNEILKKLVQWFHDEAAKLSQPLMPERPAGSAE